MCSSDSQTTHLVNEDKNAPKLSSTHTHTEFKKETKLMQSGDRFFISSNFALCSTLMFTGE